MKKKFLFVAAVISFSVQFSHAQTAADFSASDCQSNPHNLYTSLDSQRVIILDWVMPCSSCIGPSLTAYNIAQSYATSNPGVVEFYLIDDVGNTNCTTLSNWANSNSIGPNMTVFSTSSIVETNYGGTGMPHIAIVGGSNHQIYFNQFNSAAGDVTGIQNAINSALAALGLKQEMIPQNKISISPNPANDVLVVSAEFQSNGNSIATIFDINGQAVLEDAFQSGENRIDILKLPSGIYFLKITGSGLQSAATFVIE